MLLRLSFPTVSLHRLHCWLKNDVHELSLGHKIAAKCESLGYLLRRRLSLFYLKREFAWRSEVSLGAEKSSFELKRHRKSSFELKKAQKTRNSLLKMWTFCKQLHFCDWQRMKYPKNLDRTKKCYIISYIINKEEKTKMHFRTYLCNHTKFWRFLSEKCGF